MGTKNRRPLILVQAALVGSALVTLVSFIILMRQPLALTYRVRFEVPPGTELFVGGRRFVGATELVDADLFAVWEEFPPDTVFPPPGVGGPCSEYSSSEGIERLDYLHFNPGPPPERVWYCKLTNRDTEKRVALRFHAVDIQGRGLDSIARGEHWVKEGMFNGTFFMGFCLAPLD
jgi:hypothetical protein